MDENLEYDAAYLNVVNGILAAAGSETGNAGACKFTCVSCNVEKLCGTYTADGNEYTVCVDCADSFITENDGKVEKATCSGCQIEKECGKYAIDGQEYLVCPEDFNEFATGMRLIEE